jgi:hypothetical protein
MTLLLPACTLPNLAKPVLPPSKSVPHCRTLAHVQHTHGHRMVTTQERTWHDTAQYAFAKMATSAPAAPVTTQGRPPAGCWKG